MGEQIKAICKCDYEKTVSFGGGLLTYQEIEYFPYCCNDCHEVVEGNLKSYENKCPNCKSSNVFPYNKKSLVGKTKKKIIAQSFNTKLFDGNYKCPRCQNMSLKFHKTGLLFD